MKRFAGFSRFRWRRLIVLVLIGVAIGLVAVWRSPKAEPFMVLHEPFRRPVPWRDRLTGWIPTGGGWAWAWRVEEGVFGRRKFLDIYAEVVSLGDSSRGTLSRLSLGPPSFSDTNGLQVWLLGADRLEALRERFKQTPGVELLSRSRMSTGDGTECRMFVGETISLEGSTNHVGLALDCFPRLHSKSTDLTAGIMFSELVTNPAVAGEKAAPRTVVSIRTNLDAALRVQIPKGSGLFLYDRRAEDSGRRGIGVMIDLPQSKT